MMHVLMSTTRPAFAAAAHALAADQGIWTWREAVPTADPAVQRVELTVGDATREFRPAQIRDIIMALAAS
jgi:hypothetical protein